MSTWLPGGAAACCPPVIARCDPGLVTVGAWDGATPPEGGTSEPCQTKENHIL